jgi:hypothetical protein
MGKFGCDCFTAQPVYQIKRKLCGSSGPALPPANQIYKVILEQQMADIQSKEAKRLQ